MTPVSSPIQEVALNRHQLMSIIHQMRDALLVFDSHETVIAVNSAFERWVNPSYQSLIGQSIAQVFAPLAPDMVPAIREGVKRREPFEGEMMLELPQQQRRWFVYHAVPIAQQDDPYAEWAVILNDVTDVRQTEKMRRDFVANVSHELRTPLSAIHGYAETLLEGALADASVASDFVGIIFNHSRRLSSLVQDLLDLSKLESNAPPEMHPLSLTALIEKIIQMNHKLIDNKSLTLKTDFDAQLPLVLANEGTLEQVITNLVDNAIKYTPESGSITIACQEALPGRIQVNVTDTGMGIEAKHISRLFERFYRVDKARSRDLGGTGLGLSIVKHIIQNHGGDVWVTSTPGIGSTFSFTLQVASSPNELNFSPKSAEPA